MMRVWFWRVLQILALVLLAGFPLSGMFLARSAAGWLGVLLLLALHAAELPIALPLAREKGVPAGMAVLKNLLFGFTWWLPLKRGVIQR